MSEIYGSTTDIVPNGTVREPAIKHDDGKTPWDLLPMASVEPMVKVLGFGAAKYGRHNWHKLHDWRNRYFAAALRHLTAWQDGERNDAESGLPHLAHAMCNLLFLIDHERTEERNK